MEVRADQSREQSTPSSSLASASTSATVQPAVSALEHILTNLDITKHRGPAGALQLLRYLAKLEQSLEEASDDSVTACYDNIDSRLTQITASSSEPSQDARTAFNGRPFRRLCANVYNILFTKRDSKGLYEKTQAWLAAACEQRLNPESRLTALEMLRFVLAVHGARVSSLHLDILTGCGKIVRTASSGIRLRYAACQCLAVTFSLAGDILPETAAKDWSKSLRSLIGDRSGTLRQGASEALAALYGTAISLHTLVELDATVLACMKALGETHWLARRSLVSLVARILLLTQVERLPARSASNMKTVSASQRNADSTEEEHDKNTTDRSQQTKAAPVSMLPLVDVLERLAVAYNRSTSNAIAKNTIIDVYATLLSGLGPVFLETNYSQIYQHVNSRILLGSYASTGMREESISAAYVHILLGDLVAQQFLSERGQTIAMEEMLKTLLEERATSHRSTGQRRAQIFSILQEMCVLFRISGTSRRFTDTTVEVLLLQLLVDCETILRKQAARTLACYASTDPSRLQSLALQLLEELSHQLHTLKEDDGILVLHGIAGRAEAITSILRLASQHPMYFSPDIASRAISLAIRMLRDSAEHTLAISAIEIRAAWSIISGAMSFGPSVIRMHLPQLMLLWKNALPKSTNKPSTAAEVKFSEEWSFLLDIREAALDSILSLIKHGSEDVLTEDVTRRIIVMLSQALAFASAIPPETRQSYHQAIRASPKTSHSQTVSTASSFGSFHKRLNQCVIELGAHSALRPLRKSLATHSLNFLLQLSHTTTSTEQFSDGNLTPLLDKPVWEVGNWYGNRMAALGSADRVLDAASPSLKLVGGQETVEYALEAILRKSITNSKVESMEPSSKCSTEGTQETNSVTLLDSSIELYGTCLPDLVDEDQTATLQQAKAALDISAATDADTLSWHGRLAAVTAALSVMLRRLSTSRDAVYRLASGSFALIIDILKLGLHHKDPILRKCSADTYGRLCTLSNSSAFLASQMQSCVAQIVSDTSPDSRAGSTQFLGSVYSRVGPLAGAPALKLIVDVTTSLVLDPHPAVHFWALRSLASVITTAGLDFQPYVRSTIGTLVSVYAAGTHEPEGGAESTNWLAGTLPIYEALSANLDAVVGAIGPGLDDTPDLQEVVVALAFQLLSEADLRVSTHAGKALQQLLLVSPMSLSSERVIAIIRRQLESSQLPTRIVAIDSVYQLVQREVGLTSKLGGTRFVQQLVGILNESPRIEGVKQTIHSWIAQTGSDNPSPWVLVILEMLTNGFRRTTIVVEGSDQSLVDDEESLGLGSTSEQSTTVVHNIRWQTHQFLVNMLRHLLRTVRLGRNNEQVDPSVTISKLRHPQSRAHYLYNRIPDLIKISFSAVSAGTTEVKLEGLNLLADIVETFSHSRDIDFDNAPLLRQYQASIISALVPALEGTPSPEIAIASIRFCAQLVSSSIFANISEVSRALSFLKAMLEQVKDREGVNAHQVDPAAQVLRTTTLYAWANIAVASQEKEQLWECLLPDVPELRRMWTSHLLDTAAAELGVATIFRKTPGSSQIGVPSGLSGWTPVCRALLQACIRSTSEGEVAPYLEILLGLAVKAFMDSAAIGADDADGYRELKEVAACYLDLCSLLPNARPASCAIIAQDALGAVYKLYLLESSRVDAVLVPLLKATAELSIQGSQPIPSSIAEPSVYDTSLMLLLNIFCRTLERSNGGPLDDIWQALLALQGGQRHNAMMNTTILALCTEYIDRLEITHGVLTSLALTCTAIHAYNVEPAQLASPISALATSVLDHIDGSRLHSPPATTIRNSSTTAGYLSLLLVLLLSTPNNVVHLWSTDTLRRVSDAISAALLNGDATSRSVAQNYIKTCLRASPGHRHIGLVLSRLAFAVLLSDAIGLAVEGIGQESRFLQSHNLLSFIAFDENPLAILKFAICLFPIMSSQSPSTSSSAQYRDMLLDMRSLKSFSVEDQAKVLSAECRSQLEQLVQSANQSRYTTQKRATDQLPVIALKSF